jgi:hypothetical protein
MLRGEINRETALGRFKAGSVGHRSGSQVNFATPAGFPDGFHGPFKQGFRTRRNRIEIIACGKLGISIIFHNIHSVDLYPGQIAEWN